MDKLPFCRFSLSPPPIHCFQFRSKSSSKSLTFDQLIDHFNRYLIAQKISCKLSLAAIKSKFNENQRLLPRGLPINKKSTFNGNQETTTTTD